LEVVGCGLEFELCLVWLLPLEFIGVELGVVSDVSTKSLSNDVIWYSLVCLLSLSDLRAGLSCCVFLFVLVCFLGAVGRASAPLFSEDFDDLGSDSDR
jgi:hypothetical protein